MWKKSLKCRFIFTLILPILAVLALACLGGYFAARHEVDEIYDAQLANMAKTLMALMEHEAAEGDSSTEALEARFREVSHEYEKYTALRIWQGKNLFFYTKSAVDFGPQHVIAGFSNKEIKENDWRFFVLPDASLNFTVEVAEEYSVRQDLIQKIILTMFVPFLLLLLLLPPLFWFGLQYGLKPLLHISQYVGHRSPDDLTPIILEKSPAEIWPLTHAINDLMQRVNNALMTERRFADLTAHELRTPLAVIRTQVQNVINSKDEQERSELLEDLKAGTERASSMVTQLLSLARMGQEGIALTALSLNDATRAVMQGLLPLALQKHVALEFEERAQVTIAANQEVLSIALRNILDNAIKYTPAGGVVQVTVYSEGNTASLTIRDTGPGIPENKIPLVTERFYRIPGNTETGAGLGLAILSRAAQVSQASLKLANHPEGGLVVSLTWNTLH